MLLYVNYYHFYYFSFCHSGHYMQGAVEDHLPLDALDPGRPAQVFPVEP